LIVFFVLNVILDASFFERTLLYNIRRQSRGKFIPEHESSLDANPMANTSFHRRNFVEQFVVETS
jgi:hypothetical protein